jgi:hypothetical protein
MPCSTSEWSRGGWAWFIPCHSQRVSTAWHNVVLVEDVCWYVRRDMRISTLMMIEGSTGDGVFLYGWIHEAHHYLVIPSFIDYGIIQVLYLVRVETDRMGIWQCPFRVSVSYFENKYKCKYGCCQVRMRNECQSNTNAEMFFSILNGYEYQNNRLMSYWESTIRDKYTDA